MDILASIFAYLGCVTGIVGALAMSFYLVFAAPNPALTPVDTMAMATKSDLLRTAIAPRANPVANIARADTHVASRVPSQEASQVASQKASQDALNVSTADASPATAAPAAKKTQLAHAQLLRRLAQEDRARRWAYQQDPSFETRFLGYAD
jgi:hypothetical protein